MLQSNKNVQECDAATDDSSNTVWSKKIKYQVYQAPLLPLNNTLRGYSRQYAV